MNWDIGNNIKMNFKEFLMNKSNELRLGGENMKITKKQITYLKEISSPFYDEMKVEFLFHSNKLEGSTFDEEQLITLLTENKVQGEHSIDDVQETINSLKLFDFVIDTLREELTPRLLKEFNSLLKQNTKQDEYGLIGVYKKIPNKLLGVNIETAQPFEVEEKINNLLKIEIKNVENIANFHQEFEHIHPFQDGNGRIGRFIILRQCILNNIDLIAIDNEFEREYKENLYIAQTQNNIKPLVETFSKCQERLEKKLKGLKEVLKELDKNMIKTLKFRKNLSELILKNEKNTTWRIFDDKDIKEGDIIQFLVWETREAFAKAKIINVVEKKFKDLDEKDMEGHEKFVSKEEMYATYSTYYNKTVDENTMIKIIKFELL